MMPYLFYELKKTLITLLLMRFPSAFLMSNFRPLLSCPEVSRRVVTHNILDFFQLFCDNGCWLEARRIKTTFSRRKVLKKILVLSTVVLVCISSIASADSFGMGGNQFEINFVPISGSTNPTSGYGIVNNDYRMGIYEITNDKWNKFQAAYGTVTGTPSGAYDDAPLYTGTSVPTNEVSWYEGAQFVNWLNTSTGHQAAYKFTGTQGTGDYTFDIWDVTETDGTNLYRHKDAHYFMPTEDEWVKAAYWNGTSLQAFVSPPFPNPPRSCC